MILIIYWNNQQRVQTEVNHYNNMIIDQKTVEKKGKSQRKRLLEVDEESVTKMLKLNEQMN